MLLFFLNCHDCCIAVQYPTQACCVVSMSQQRGGDWVEDGKLFIQLLGCMSASYETWNFTRGTPHTPPHAKNRVIKSYKLTKLEQVPGGL